jgi:twitching motility protein PilJ
VETITVSIAASLMLFGASTWNVWTIYRSFRTSVTNQFQIESLSGKIVHLDEVLTMSARMAASTGDLKWEKRYRQFEPDLDQAIKQTTQLAPQVVKAQSAQTDTANLKLVEFENRAFALVREGKRQEAFNLLLSQDYDAQKQIYAQGIENIVTNLKTETKTQLQSQSQRLLWAIVFACVSFPILLLGWLIVLSLVRTYIRERQLAQDALLESQTSLLKLNEQLETKAVQVLEQEQATKQENEVLQADVSQLLDVVSAVEEGNLTVQAIVSDRPTGLVADTLNRLIEELTQIMSIVLSSAQQVTQGAGELQQLAVATTVQAQQQTQSVSEVQALMVNFNHLSQDTAQQALVSDEAVQQAQVAIVQGQQEMVTMTQEIGILQQGTEQIVQRAQMLTNFVTLADQFSKDQKRVAALTRVLALNASMIATRASGQQDPEQFASVAREFEAIATQVNDLAEKTNQSLLQLQQRTDQIQTVVSGINQDVQDISNSVNQFTLSVDQSREIFNNIKTVTDRVAMVGQQVTQSSQAIATTAQLTLQSIQEIATVTAQTETHSHDTREQAGLMDQLAHNLLEKVRFFRLSENNSDN